MKKIFLLMIMVLASCSSNDSSRKYASDEALKLEDDYNWVEGLDFDKKTETKYQADSDEFKNKIPDTTNVLIKETVSTLSNVRLEEQLKESDDPLAKIVIKCYQNKFEEAFQTIDQVYAQFKNNTSYWNQVGTCYYLKGDYSKAILFYNKSRDLDPKFSPPINNLGVVYQKQNRFQKALSAYKRANEVSEFSITPAFNLARLYLQYGVISKAEPILVGLNKKTPNDPQVTTALAVMYLIKNDLNNSIATFSMLSKENLAKPEVGLNYALALKLSNKNDEAKNALSAITESTGEIKSYAQKVEALVRN